MIRWLFITLLVVISCKAFAQKSNLYYYNLEKLSFKSKAFNDSVFKRTGEDDALNYFKLNGYTGLFLVDSVFKKEATHYNYGYTQKFDKIVLINQNSAKKKPYPTKNYFALLERLNKKIKLLENTGYPFAKIDFTELVEDADKLILSYQIDSGAFFIIDEINLKSTDEFHEKTMLNIFGLKPGEVYNESKIRTINTILENSELYSLKRPVELLFRDGKAALYVYFEKRKSSSADGFVGFQQDQLTQKINLNGYLNLELNNVLNRVETIDLRWKNNPDKTQELKTLIEYPYLFNSQFGVGTDIRLKKQDTSFVRSDVLLEIIYRTPKVRLSLFDQIENSNTISSVPIPGFRNYKKNTIGINLRYRPFMPEKLKFFHPAFSIMVGTFNYRSDTLDDNKQKLINNKYSVKYEQTIDFLQYFHLNNVLELQTISSSIGLSRNELLYFGGLNSVRGFYELELFGKTIWTLLNEVEFRPIESLSLKAIYDYSVFDNNQHNYTHSFGFGFGLINNTNQLEIIVANGILNKNPVNFAGTKVHIGFKSNF